MSFRFCNRVFKSVMVVAFSIKFFGKSWLLTKAHTCSSPYGGDTIKRTPSERRGKAIKRPAGVSPSSLPDTGYIFTRCPSLS